MSRLMLNIAKSYADGFIADFEKNKYFSILKGACNE